MTTICTGISSNLICLSLIQVFMSSALSGQAILYSDSFSYSLSNAIEHQGDIFLSLEDELVDSTQYAIHIIRLDENLDPLPIAQLDFGAQLGNFYGGTGRLFEIEGRLEFAGSILKREITGGGPTGNDSIFFVHATWSTNYDQVELHTHFLRTGIAYPVDIAYRPLTNDFLFAYAGFFLEYWLAVVDREMYAVQYSENRFYNLGSLPFLNPDRLLKILNKPEMEHIELRVTGPHIDFFGLDAQYDSTYIIPTVNVNGDNHPWTAAMSTGAVFFEDSYIIGTNYVGGHIIHLSNENEYLYEFQLYFGDSTCFGSTHHCIAADAEKKLYLAAHVKAEDEAYARSLKVVKCDTLGNIFWQHDYVEPDAEVKYQHKQILVSDAGEVVMIANRFSDPEAGRADAVIVYKLSIEGELTGVVELEWPISSSVVYPNPGNGAFMINALWETSEYIILDFKGNVLLSDKVKGNMIELSNLPAGAYNIVLRSKDGKQTYSRVVKE